MSQNMKRLRWITINGIILIAAIWGLIYGNEPAANIALFALWFTSITMLISSVVRASWARLADGDPKATEALLKSDESFANMSVPYPLDVAYDIVMLCLIVGTGYFVLGVFYALATLLLGVARQEALRRKAEQNQPTTVTQE